MTTPMIIRVYLNGFDKDDKEIDNMARLSGMVDTVAGANLKSFTRNYDGQYNDVAIITAPKESVADILYYIQQYENLIDWHTFNA